MRIVLFDTINKIPSHKQFQHLAAILVKRGHEVIQFSDTIRENYDGVTVISYNNKNILQAFKKFFNLFSSKKIDVVISTFRGNIYADVLSYFFNFKWIAFRQSDFYNSKLSI
jgi:hypothetical protein